MSTTLALQVEPEAHELLRTSAMALSWFRRRIPSMVLDELCQEAAIRTLQAVGVEDPAAFVHQVARRLAVDWLRRRREHSWDDQVERIGDARWADGVEHRLDAKRVLSVLESAPPAYRALIEALYFRHLDLEDLVRDELASRDEQERPRVRDALYKRRTRALGWLRSRLRAA